MKKTLHILLSINLLSVSCRGYVGKLHPINLIKLTYIN